MTWDELRYTANHALNRMLCVRKLSFAYGLLLLSGLVAVFCKGLALHTNTLVAISLGFLSFFFCAALLLAGGIVLVRVYHDEVKGKSIAYTTILKRSWQPMFIGSYLVLPFLFSYLFVWFLLALFSFLRNIPYLGEVVSVVFVFAPFLLHITALALALLALCTLFFVTPITALRGSFRLSTLHVIWERVKQDPFSAILQLLIALVPALFTAALLYVALFLTRSSGFASEEPMQQVLQWLFLLIPCAVFFVPSLLFFFQFAAEAHALSQEKQSEIG